jgi:hypothetical protein
MLGRLGPSQLIVLPFMEGGIKSIIKGAPSSTIISLESAAQATKVIRTSEAIIVLVII